MKRLIFVLFLIAAITLTLADTNMKQIIAFTPLTSSMVHTFVLQRRARASAVTRGLKSGRRVG